MPGARGRRRPQLVLRALVEARPHAQRLPTGAPAPGDLPHLAAAVASQHFLTRTDVTQVNLSQTGRQNRRNGRRTVSSCQTSSLSCPLAAGGFSHLAGSSQ
eukprot:SAG25_NODE_998_length_4355_cov_10.937265_7_plen_101_part_00